jgi:hypothetical protein
MYNVKKSSASGLWSGEVYKSFDSRAEALDYLKDLAATREDSGYNAYWLKDDTLELTHDDRADAFTYWISDNSRECAECGSSFIPDDRELCCSHSCDVMYAGHTCNCDECEVA